MPSPDCVVQGLRCGAFRIRNEDFLQEFFCLVWLCHTQLLRLHVSELIPSTFLSWIQHSARVCLLPGLRKVQRCVDDILCFFLVSNEPGKPKREAKDCRKVCRRWN